MAAAGASNLGDRASVEWCAAVAGPVADGVAPFNTGREPGRVASSDELGERFRELVRRADIMAGPGRRRRSLRD